MKLKILDCITQSRSKYWIENFSLCVCGCVCVMGCHVFQQILVKFWRSLLFMDEERELLVIHYWQIIWFGVITWKNLRLDVIYNSTTFLWVLTKWQNAWWLWTRHDARSCGEFKDEENIIHTFRIWEMQASNSGWWWWWSFAGSSWQICGTGMDCCMTPEISEGWDCLWKLLGKDRVRVCWSS